MTDLIVRPAKLADAAEAVAVLRESITVSCVVDHQNDAETLAQWLRNKTVEHFAYWLEQPDLRVVVAERSARICGVASLHRIGEIRLCYVEPASQRSGVGRALLTAIEAQAASWGIGELELASSLAARTFYERFGYQTAGQASCGFGISRCYPYRKTLPAR